MLYVRPITSIAHPWPSICVSQPSRKSILCRSIAQRRGMSFPLMLLHFRPSARKRAEVEATMRRQRLDIFGVTQTLSRWHRLKFGLVVHGA